MQENSKATTAIIDTANTTVNLKETNAEETNAEKTSSELQIPEIAAATDEQILAYLRRSCRLAEIASASEQDAVVIAICEQFGITVSDEEWQAAGDAFRMEHKLLSPSATIDWLEQQRTTVEAWSEGIKIQLLTEKLKDHLFGAAVDSSYFVDRDRHQRVALSQILVVDLATAHMLVRRLKEKSASFCALALEYSKGRQSQMSGGFVGVRLFAELMPEILQAVRSATEGEIIGPVQTKLGYHILKVEKWYPVELNESIRKQLINVLFQTWMQELHKEQGRSEL